MELFPFKILITFKMHKDRRNKQGLENKKKIFLCVCMIGRELGPLRHS